MHPLRLAYTRLPNILKPYARSFYKEMHPDKKTDNQIRSEFIQKFFENRGEFDRYIAEFQNGPVVERRKKGLHEYGKLTGSKNLGGVDYESGKLVYALIRKLNPNTIIETGVCNGLSTLYILLALDQNGSGDLYSIDYPYRTTESLDEFRKDTFEGYQGAAIPADKDPGWIVPNELREYWTLRIGKSQRELPELVSHVDEVDFFLHDSEHSIPCMLFEFEIAWEWLSTEGVIVADDIGWNDAVDIFTEARNPNRGLVSPGVAYLKR